MFVEQRGATPRPAPAYRNGYATGWLKRRAERRKWLSTL
jgi:hypothetical protein